jgi:hypothetical protein
MNFILMLVLTADPQMAPHPVAAYKTLAECHADARRANASHSIMKDADLAPLKPRFECFERKVDWT